MKNSAVFWQQIEGLVILLLSSFAYHQYGFGWLLFGLLFFVPDVSMVGYIKGNEVGAMAYNAFHNYAVPIVLGVVGSSTGNKTAVAVGLIWVAHIGFDRCFGYGLKLASGFNDTHLGTVGRK